MRSLTKSASSFWIIAAMALLVWTVVVNRTPQYNITEVSVSDAHEMVEQRRAVVIDVRSREAFNKGHVPNAIAVPVDEMKDRIQSLPIAKTDDIVIYCNDGVSTGPRATAILNEQGFAKAVNVKGGIEGWKAAGFRVTQP